MDGRVAELEERLLRNKHDIKTWIHYLHYKRGSDVSNVERFCLFRRALQVLPYSYKLWHQYLHERLLHVRYKPHTNLSWKFTQQEFERCMQVLDKMPVLWLLYTEFMSCTPLITETRRIFNRALQSLPVSQHEMIWTAFIKWAQNTKVAETVCIVWERFLVLRPEGVEQYLQYLEGNDLPEKAVQILYQRLVSIEEGMDHVLWQRIKTLISKYPEQVSKVLDVDTFLRSGLLKYASELASTWCALADFYTSMGRFEHARGIYRESLDTLQTSLDFNLVFKAFTSFEESLLSAKFASLEENPSSTLELDIDMSMNRLEQLLDNRPLLLNSVQLRADPLNVGTWIERVKLVEPGENHAKVIQTYSEALETFSSQRKNHRPSSGRVSDLWKGFSEYYERLDNVENARIVFQNSLKESSHDAKESQRLYRYFAEFEIRQEQLKSASHILSQATKKYPNTPKLWSAYSELEEKIGTFTSCCAVYDKCLEYKGGVTPGIILKYCKYLQQSNYWEQSFRIYEKGLELFKFPHSQFLWKDYLIHFQNRYQGTRLERCRDIFEQCLQDIPKASEECKEFYVMYSIMESKFGIGHRLMNIFERACTNVLPNDQYEIIRLWIDQSKSVYENEPDRIRLVFDKCIELVNSDQDLKRVCLEYAEMEKGLGEIDRARCILVYGGQATNPFQDLVYWKRYEQFEIEFGNEETFRDMLVLKRTLEGKFQNVSFVKETEAPENIVHGDENPDEIDLDEDLDDNVQEIVDIEEKPIPASIKGGLGALERFKTR